MGGGPCVHTMWILKHFLISFNENFISRDAVFLTRVILAQGRAVTALAASVAAEAAALTPDIQTGDDLGDGDVIRSS